MEVVKAASPRFPNIWATAAIGLLTIANVNLQAEGTPLEYQVKAAFLYNFGKFVEWPPSAFKTSGDAFIIGILGDDPFGADVETKFEGKTIQEKSLRFRHIDHVADISGCAIVYISNSESARVDAILESLKGAPVLTVSDAGRFVQNGGIVGFSTENNKVRFGINLSSAEKSGLKISSQLLKLAKVVQGKPEGAPAP